MTQISETMSKLYYGNPRAKRRYSLNTSRDAPTISHTSLTTTGSKSRLANKFKAIGYLFVGSLIGSVLLATRPSSCSDFTRCISMPELSSNRSNTFKAKPFNKLKYACSGRIDIINLLYFTTGIVITQILIHTVFKDYFV